MSNDRIMFDNGTDKDSVVSNINPLPVTTTGGGVATETTPLDALGNPVADFSAPTPVEVAATANRWSYAAAASGIVNTTTAVTIKAAAGASLRNYVTSIQIMAEALGAATELAIRDGAGGTVLWRTKIGTGGIIGGEAIVFPSPLKGTANTLLEVVTLTASVTGAVYFNAQGFIAA